MNNLIVLRHLWRAISRVVELITTVCEAMTEALKETNDRLDDVCDGQESVESDVEKLQQSALIEHVLWEGMQLSAGGFDVSEYGFDALLRIEGCFTSNGTDNSVNPYEVGDHVIFLRMRYSDTYGWAASSYVPLYGYFYALVTAFATTDTKIAVQSTIPDESYGWKFYLTKISVVENA